MSQSLSLESLHAHFHTVFAAREQMTVHHDEHSGDKSMVASTAIKTGDLLLLEHLAKGDFTLLGNLIQTNELLYNSLHPRTAGPWDLKTAQDLQPSFQKTIKDKIQNNCFGGNVDPETKQTHYYLGYEFPNFNHRADPNAVTQLFTSEDKSSHLVGIFAVQDITPGEEITFFYSEGYAKILKTDLISIQRREAYQQIITQAAEKARQDVVSRYFESERCKIILRNQIMVE